MAEGTSVKQDDVVCRFFLTSGCRDGDSCPFSHDSTRSTPDNVCRYFLQGTCSFGQNCRYDHIAINKEYNSLRDRPSNRDAAFSFPRIPDASKRNPKPPGFGILSSNTDRNEASAQNVPFSPSISNLLQVPILSGPVSFQNWIHVPEFVPKSRSYADMVKGITTSAESEKMPSSELCPYFMMGECPLEQYCSYVHGDVCELCQKACLHPQDEVQRKVHTEQCEKAMEQDMEFSFAIQRSTNKTCGICMDVILEKEPMSERRFGILENCKHVFCLSCIRQWRRGSKQQIGNSEGADNVLDPAVRRSCPQCRISSDFVTPSTYFVDTDEDKKQLLSEYKNALSKKHCKYFRKGEGVCPFGGTCFYLHANPDGTKVELPPFVPRRRENQFGEIVDVDQILLWNYLENRDEDVINFGFSRLNISVTDSDADSVATTVSEW